MCPDSHVVNLYSFLLLRSKASSFFGHTTAQGQRGAALLLLQGGTAFVCRPLRLSCLLSHISTIHVSRAVFVSETIRLCIVKSEYMYMFYTLHEIMPTPDCSMFERQVLFVEDMLRIEVGVTRNPRRRRPGNEGHIPPDPVSSVSSPVHQPAAARRHT